MSTFRTLSFLAVFASAPAYSATLAGTALVDAARPCALAFAEARWGSMATEIEVAVVGAPQTLAAVGPAVTLECGAARLVAGARIAVPLVVRGGESTVRTVWFAASGLQNVLVARRAFRNGERVESKDVLITSRRLPLGETVPHASSFNPSGLRTRTAIAAGEIVDAVALEPVPWVEARQRVTVRVAGAGVHLATRGTALRDGGPGELVDVVVVGTDSQVRGRVSAVAEVTLDD